MAKGMRLEPGEHVKVAGSGGASHTVTMSAKGNLYCSCPAWKSYLAGICCYCERVSNSSFTYEVCNGQEMESYDFMLPVCRECMELAPGKRFTTVGQVLGRRRIIL